MVVTLCNTSIGHQMADAVLFQQYNSKSEILHHRDVGSSDVLFAFYFFTYVFVYLNTICVLIFDKPLSDQSICVSSR